MLKICKSESIQKHSRPTKVWLWILSLARENHKRSIKASHWHATQILRGVGHKAIGIFATCCHQIQGLTESNIVRGNQFQFPTWHIPAPYPTVCCLDLTIGRDLRSSSWPSLCEGTARCLEFDLATKLKLMKKIAEAIWSQKISSHNLPKGLVLPGPCAMSFDPFGTFLDLPWFRNQSFLTCCCFQIHDSKVKSI